MNVHELSYLICRVYRFSSKVGVGLQEKPPPPPPPNLLPQDRSRMSDQNFHSTKINCSMHVVVLVFVKKPQHPFPLLSFPSKLEKIWMVWIRGAT